MNYLALDVGKKRIGVAISTSGIIVCEYETIKNIDIKDTPKKINSIIKNEQIEKLVIGLPISMNKSDSDYTKYVRNFAHKLKKNIKIPIILEDERLTTNEAKRQLIALGASEKEIRDRIDQYSAKLILEQYLENQ